MRDLKRILVGHDLAAGGDLALRSAAAVAHRCGATLRLVHVVEPLNPYQRISHPLTTPFTLEEIAQKTGERLQALAASPDLAGRAEYEVRSGKPFVDLIVAARAWSEGSASRAVAAARSPRPHGPRGNRSGAG